MSERPKFETVGQYMESFQGETRKVLDQLRQVIRETAPDAVEVISYNVPALKYNGKFLTYFAGYDHHVSISFVPTEPIYELFKDELKNYKKSKSTIQFPLTESLPVDLIRKIIEFRVGELEK